MARMDADAVGNARAKVESELAKVKNTLPVVEEARQKAEDEASHLANERVSLLLELGTCKDEVSAIQEEALKEKKALEEAYKEGFDIIFNYGYGYCLLHIIFAEVNPRFQTRCRTRLSRYLQSSLLTLVVPRVLSLSMLHPSMFVLVK